MHFVQDPCQLFQICTLLISLFDLLSVSLLQLHLRATHVSLCGTSGRVFAVALLLASVYATRGADATSNHFIIISRRLIISTTTQYFKLRILKPRRRYQDLFGVLSHSERHELHQIVRTRGSSAFGSCSVC